MRTDARLYSKTEEILNVATHGIGFLMSLAALSVLVVFSSLYGTAWHIVSFSIYGASLVILYLASTAFHLVQKQKVRNWLNVFDHISIYFNLKTTFFDGGYVLCLLNMIVPGIMELWNIGIIPFFHPSTIPNISFIKKSALTHIARKSSKSKKNLLTTPVFINNSKTGNLYLAQTQAFKIFVNSADKM